MNNGNTVDRRRRNYKNQTVIGKGYWRDHPIKKYPQYVEYIKSIEFTCFYSDFIIIFKTTSFGGGHV